MHSTWPKVNIKEVHGWGQASSFSPQTWRLICFSGDAHRPQVRENKSQSPCPVLALLWVVSPPSWPLFFSLFVFLFFLITWEAWPLRSLWQLQLSTEVVQAACLNQRKLDDKEFYLNSAPLAHNPGETHSPGEGCGHGGSQKAGRETGSQLGLQRWEQMTQHIHSDSLCLPSFPSPETEKQIQDTGEDFPGQWFPT